jgi:coenzyme F420 hydrogenase subunit delta
MIQEIFDRPVLIFGCGNVLLGDDGFGPAVIERLNRDYRLPRQIAAVDVGTSVRDLLFDLLLVPTKPRRIFIIDAVSQPGKSPGELFELDLHELPVYKTNDFSLHQFPSVNLLEELKSSAGVDVRVLVVQAKDIPDEVRPGISPEVEAAIPRACAWLWEQIEGDV